MAKTILEPTLEHRVIEGYRCPLGVYPLEELTPRQGYCVEFEAADGGEDAPIANGDADPIGPGEWEEWPDRFMFDVLISTERLPALFKAVLSMLPGRVYPILDVLGNDAYREIDPYIAYELVGLERLIDGVARYHEWLFEDGLVGFGALSVEPFISVLVDEHKALTLRVGTELKDDVEKLLQAFGLSEVEEILGPDSVAHQHTPVLVHPSVEAEAISAEEIVERLRDSWLLQLNIDTQQNIDDDGVELGVTAWRCLLRCAEEEEGADEGSPVTYVEVLLSAGCLDDAEAGAVDAATEHAPEGKSWYEVVPVVQDRLTAEDLAKLMGERTPMRSGVRTEAAGGGGESAVGEATVHAVHWFLDAPPEDRGKKG